VKVHAGPTGGFGLREVGGEAGGGFEESSQNRRFEFGVKVLMTRQMAGPGPRFAFLTE
jgi:hypothetical protein